MLTFESISNKTVLLRADLNEALASVASTSGTEQRLVSTGRIDASIKTIQELLARKNNIILISHLSDNKQSLLPMVNYIKKIFPDLIFIQSLNTDEIKNEIQGALNQSKVTAKNPLIIIENLRSFANEVEEKNNENFAQFLAGLADVFVYDAFSVAHRKHASVVSVSQFLPHTLGPVAKRELDALTKILHPEKPELVILGGAKLSTKLPLIEQFLASGADVFLGGAMAHPLLAKKGIDIKNSLTENIELSPEIINNKKLHLPGDYVWDRETQTKIVDVGEKSLRELEQLIRQSKTILWNGPLGLYESGYDVATNTLINMLDFSKNENLKKTFVVVGGGDTLAALEKVPDFTCSYISLSGGAMLDFLAKDTLPGIEANK